MRRPYRELLSDKLDKFDNQPTAYIHPPETEVEQVIAKELNKMSPEDQELIYEYYFDRLSYRQMGNLRGRTHGYVYHRTNRAIDRLRQQVASNGVNAQSDL